MEQARVVADAILAASADAVVASDSEGIIRIWNPGAERIFGYAESEAVGKSLDIITPERLRKRHWDGYRRTMATGESRYGEGALLSVPAIRKDGQQISVEFTLVPLKDEQGTMTGVVAVMRDVTVRFTELKALRERLAKASEERAGAA
ncbi:PAS domain-containing protein [Methylorubrum extorquens]|jgi:PAS domain S-box-containing protein|uniref:PAS/PAC sensor protein n=2 Tax=Methylorubrum extorquens TaxID=408 RepID=C5AZU8_METEA|nr:PAS domain S-box protein [Methylorubrum extorquens]ACS41472.1 putative PAS/PAC sensor protein [Methylorubrum extorquens AM1]MCP1540344.1 PAS domain S-box-containing protein [Methylorubrum extorquens]MCP1587119.1 PAS domain S-box-containing protein [Methylorubrum extorquens]UYW30331.1 PAS domain S-box protein [Methylorubrum extorquens]CAX26119.1 putative PAS/PAC sensor protein [Methylorubrum extorquens DM4]